MKIRARLGATLGNPLGSLEIGGSTYKLKQVESDGDLGGNAGVAHNHPPTILIVKGVGETVLWHEVLESFQLEACCTIPHEVVATFASFTLQVMKQLGVRMEMEYD